MKAKMELAAATQRKEALEEELRRIIAILVEKYQPEKIILFGSLFIKDILEKGSVLYEREKSLV